jgi:hypothetical protein
MISAPRPRLASDRSNRDAVRLTPLLRAALRSQQLHAALMRLSFQDCASPSLAFHCGGRLSHFSRSAPLRNSALSLGSDRGAGTKGGERPVVGLDVGRGHPADALSDQVWDREALRR